MDKSLNTKYGYLLDNINGYPLDKLQRKAVFCEKKHVLVIAGAGSGKTTTIIGKVKYLINAKNFSPQDILCISFTNESVNSLKQAFTDNEVSTPIVFTFHKLALSLLDNKYRIIDTDYLRFITNEIMYEYPENIRETIVTIINLFNTQGLKNKHFLNLPKKYYKLIVAILYIMIEYQKEKDSIGAIDFDDMIKKATQEVKTCTFKYIIVDEYQDSSLIRVKLIQKLIELSKANLFVVGDDWQSIYRFSGCDLNIFIKFRHFFKSPKTIKLKNTYRNSKQLIKVASSFIMKNPYQIRKTLLSNKHNSKPIKIIYYNNPQLVLEKTIKLIDKKKRILILGRNNFDINEYLNNNISLKKNEIICSFNDHIKYLSIHKSKGLESDEVIVINLKNSVYGLPSQITNHPLINYFQLSKHKYPFDEERRLFYVALTRTKNNVYLLVDKKNPSIFIKELVKGYSKYIEFIF